MFTANKFKKENIWTLNVGKSLDVEALCDTRFDKWFDCFCNLIGTKDHSGVWDVRNLDFFFFLVKNYLKWSKKLAPNSTILVDFTANLSLLLFCLSHTWWQIKILSHFIMLHFIQYTICRIFFIVFYFKIWLFYFI